MNGLIILMLQLSTAAPIAASDSISRAVHVCHNGWQSGESIFLAEGVACLSGRIKESDDQIIRRGIETNGAPNTMVVNNAGGSVKAALSIAEMIAGHEIDLIVDDGCLSSCANYFLPIAKHVYLPKDSILGWHGGPPRTVDEFVFMIRRSEPQMSESESVERAERDFPEMQVFMQRQEALYQQTEISSHVIYDLAIALGCMRGFTKYEVNELVKWARSVYWSPSAHTLRAYYGFRNLVWLDQHQAEIRPDEIHVFRFSEQPRKYHVDEGCLYQAFEQRDLAESFAASASEIEDLLSLPSIEKGDAQ